MPSEGRSLLLRRAPGARLEVEAIKLISNLLLTLVLLAPAPACQGKRAGQEHAATQAAKRDLLTGAVQVKQARTALRFHLGHPCLQGRHFTDLGVLVHDFDVVAV